MARLIVLRLEAEVKSDALVNLLLNIFELLYNATLNPVRLRKDNKVNSCCHSSVLSARKDTGIMR